MANSVTHILSSVRSGDPQAARELLAVVYDELRHLAAQQMSGERAGQTLQATALVHEAYLRLVGPDSDRTFADRRHFFAAAAQAMRHILVENARRKRRLKRGGDYVRTGLVEALADEDPGREDLEALDVALTRFADIDPVAEELVHLRYFGGLSMAEAAETLELAPRTADRLWAYARAWLHRELSSER